MKIHLKKVLPLVLIVFITIGIITFKNNFKNKDSSPIIPTIAPTPTSTPIAPIQFTQDQLQGYYDSYKDPYVIHLRKALNGYLDGTNYGMDGPASVIKPDTSINGLLGGLSSFDKSYYRSKFIVYSIDNSFAGGKDIYVVFQDKPDKVFLAWVYQLAGGAYDLRGFSQVLKYTPDNMSQMQQQYKTFLNDKIHAL